MATSLQTAAIPSRTAQCHASNLLKLSDGTLLCAWFGGSQEGLPDIAIWLSRLAPGATSWSEPQRISAVNDRSCQNPVLFKAPDTGKLWLFHTAQELGSQESAYLQAKTSDDGGKTWSEPTYPFGDRRGSLARQPVQVLKDGTWVLPVFNCRAPEGSRWIGNDDTSSLLYTKDGGKTWGVSDVPNGIGAVHMNPIRPRDSSSNWVALFRSRWADNIYRSTSKDGLNWESPKPTSLPNPNSGICGARLPNGKLVAVFNRSRAEAGLARRKGLYDDITPDSDKRPDQAASHGKEAIWGMPRKTLTVGISDDEGLTWKERVLEEGDGFCMTNDSMKKTNRELSYPSILVEEDGVTHIAFTFHRQYIKYVRVDDIEGWLDADPIA